MARTADIKVSKLSRKNIEEAEGEKKSVRS